MYTHGLDGVESGVLSCSWVFVHVCAFAWIAVGIDFGVDSKFQNRYSSVDLPIMFFIFFSLEGGELLSFTNTDETVPHTKLIVACLDN